MGAGGGCTSHPCEVRSLGSLQLSPQETLAGSWAWKRFYLPAGDLLEYFHPTQSLLEG